MNSLVNKINSINNHIKLVEENFRSCLEGEGWFPIVGEPHGYTIQSDGTRVDLYFNHVGKVKVVVTSHCRADYRETINFSLWSIKESYDRLCDQLEEIIEKVYLS